MSSRRHRSIKKRDDKYVKYGAPRGVHTSEQLGDIARRRLQFDTAAEHYQRASTITTPDYRHVRAALKLQTLLFAQLAAGGDHAKSVTETDVECVHAWTGETLGKLRDELRAQTRPGNKRDQIIYALSETAIITLAAREFNRSQMTAIIPSNFDNVVAINFHNINAHALLFRGEEPAVQHALCIRTAPSARDKQTLALTTIQSNVIAPGLPPYEANGSLPDLLVRDLSGEIQDNELLRLDRAGELLSAHILPHLARRAKQRV